MRFTALPKGGLEPTSEGVERQTGHRILLAEYAPVAGRARR